jgi:flagellar basal body-associated protein FliL
MENQYPENKKSANKIWTILGVIILLFFFGLMYYRYYFVFGEGVKAGQLNYFVKKGYVFKTHEGRLIQSGLKSQTTGGISSNEFRFSVSDNKVAEELNKNAGAYLELHYKEYLHTLPWRGTSNFIVDSVISSKPSNLSY